MRALNREKRNVLESLFFSFPLWWGCPSLNPNGFKTISFLMGVDYAWLRKAALIAFG